MFKKLLPSAVALVMVGFTVQSATASASSSPSIRRAPSATVNKKVTICHRTHSVTNPYVRITVSESAIGNGASKHGGVKHDQWSNVLFTAKPVPNVFNSTITYTPAPEKKWGDIIPNVYTDGTAFTATGAGTNYSGIGIDIYNGTGTKAGQCKVMNARDLYEIEKANGTPTQEILDDLEESKDSDEFASALTACGGSFSTCTDPSKLGTMSITAETTTTVAATTTTVAGSTATTIPGATTTTVASATGGLKVNTWIDANRNGKKSSTESNLAGMSVTITGPGGETKTALTDDEGVAEFTGLAVGKWSVKSVLSKAGYTKVYDSDGSVNWKTTLTVTAGQVASASFAAAKAATATLPTTGTSGTGVLVLLAGIMMLAGMSIILGRRRNARI